MEWKLLRTGAHYPEITPEDGREENEEDKVRLVWRTDGTGSCPVYGWSGVFISFLSGGGFIIKNSRRKNPVMTGLRVCANYDMMWYMCLPINV